MFRKKLSHKFILAAIIVFLLSVAIAPAYACSPSEQAFNYTLADRVENAPIILVGTVIKGYTREWSNHSVIVEAEVVVEKYLKGEGPTIVKISGFGDGADCHSGINLGTHAVFFANGEPDSGILNAEYLGVHDAVWQASQENIAEITGITNHSVKPYPAPFMLQVLRFFTQYRWWIFGGIIVFFCIVAVFFVRNLPSEKRKRKVKND